MIRDIYPWINARYVLGIILTSSDCKATDFPSVPSTVLITFLLCLLLPRTYSVYYKPTYMHKTTTTTFLLTSSHSSDVPSYSPLSHDNPGIFHSPFPFIFPVSSFFPMYSSISLITKHYEIKKTKLVTNNSYCTITIYHYHLLTYSHSSCSYTY